MAKRTGVQLIAEERRRQASEGFTSEHDQEHTSGEIAMAAACYAAPLPIYTHEQQSSYIEFRDPFPWSTDYDKRKQHSRLRCLVIAGALIAAEIDRIQATKRRKR